MQYHVIKVNTKWKLCPVPILSYNKQKKDLFEK